MTYDPTLPAGYQDADLEMIEAAADAADPDYDPAPRCSQCGGSGGSNDLYAQGRRRRVWIPYCDSASCARAARAEKAWVEEAM